MVAGDLVIVRNIMTTGIKNGTIGIIKEIREVGETEYIYLVHLVQEGFSVPLWSSEFEVLKSGTGRSSRSG